MTTMTIQATKAAAIRDLDDALRAALMPTDWYFIRLADPSSGEPVPEAVIAARMALREAHVARCAAVAAAEDAAAVRDVLAGA